MLGTRDSREAESPVEPARLRGEVLVVGPLPPPIMGPAVQTQMVIAALEGAGATVLHVNTQDRRTVFNTGVLDLRNVALGLLHAGQALVAARRPVRFVYVPISQGRWGYVRDVFLLAAGRLFGRPLVAHLHGANFQAFYASSTRPEQWLIRRSLGWVALAIASTPALRGVFGDLVPEDRVRVLENGIPDPWPGGVGEVLAARAERARSAAAPVRLLYIANDFATKGAATAVRALAQPGLEGCELRMIGAPPPEVAERTAALARELGVGDRVRLLGAVSEADKLAELEAADLFVYPTENDAQPLVVLEALAAGLPAVVSTFGGVPDTVGDAGVLQEPKDPVALAQRLRELIEDRERRVELGVRARRRFEDRYAPAGFDRRLPAVFADLAGSAGDAG